KLGNNTIVSMNTSHFFMCEDLTISLMYNKIIFLTFISVRSFVHSFFAFITRIFIKNKHLERYTVSMSYNFESEVTKALEELLQLRLLLFMLERSRIIKNSAPTRFYYIVDPNFQFKFDI